MWARARCSRRLPRVRCSLRDIDAEFIQSTIFSVTEGLENDSHVTRVTLRDRHIKNICKVVSVLQRDMQQGGRMQGGLYV